MKLITDHLGQIIAVIAAISLLITSIVFFKGPVGLFFENIIEKETSIGDKVFENLENVGMFDGEGGSNGSSGGADHDAPTLTVGPELSQDINLPTVVESNSMTLSGTVSDASGIASLTVNGNDVTVDASGAWSYTLALTQNEVTEVTIEAKDNAGNTATKSGYVGYIIYKEVEVGKSSYAEEIGYSDTATVLEIPATFKKDGKWYKVTKIMRNAFFDCTNLNSVTFGENIKLTIIDDRAFQSCTNLTNITIPDGVTYIGSQAFVKCTSLTSVGPVGSGASVEIPDSVTETGYSVFNGCTSLTSVNFGENSHLTIIDAYTFMNCTNLTSVTIPSSVTYIGSNVFYGCTSLSDINFEGTTTQWATISKNISWNDGVPATKVVCSDGTVSLK